jgi:universal stress protein A
MLVPTRILVPTDFSEYSDKALEQALYIAKQYKAKVFLLHVDDKSVCCTTSEFNLHDEVLEKIKDDVVACIQTYCQNQLSHFPQAAEVEVLTSVRHGVPYDEILKEGKEKKIDLIVIASLGRTGIAKYFIGSVARNVLKGSKCPVLLTK